ncbi:LOW QUALITY PROTEIN: hypothetical protein Cgig2_009366 [Carnegiea gigantea]|uniref:NB-ARC domain-containing protein n=1 Tax=Carnegiea gigantea TaxID=171969 RepID=A0A9Q1GWD4_9CARY|nr:LOW QUALITY PROTEIN: hypothetical protein Cgig2_009366 [Carnegiea gigantea]
MSRRIKDIRERVDELAKDINQFGFVMQPNEEREQPYFFVKGEEFLSRDEDMQALVETFINPNVKDAPSVTTIVGIEFLLVLDDIWNEDHDQRLKLKDFLICGAKGSTILVTTRSQVVERIMSINPPYNLGHLSDSYSQSLFAKLAFEPGCIDCNPDLVQIGKDILMKFANVPLAIQTTACLLYGEDKRMWPAFRDNDLAFGKDK